MPTHGNETDKTAEALESMITAIQDLFILHTLQAGVQVEAVRAHLGVDKWRVTKVSKLLKNARQKKKD